MIEKPKKERRFLKILGKVGEILVQELLIKVGKSLVQKIGGKKTLPSIIFLALFCNIAFASIDSIPYPITGNKQRLGWQTTGNGLVYRGNASDTVTKPSNYANKDIKAYLLLDTVNNVLYNYISSKGGWQFSNTDSIVINNNFTQPVDSLFFDTSVPTNNVDTAKMRWDSDLGTVVLGMYDKVPNELGFKSFWLVKNQTGSTITKGSIVYANGTVGASGRITVAKFIANGSIDAKYLLGITAHDLTDGEDGYVISFGKIRQVNTDTFAAGSILYPSPTVAGVWTDVEPIAPNINMPIGFCINSSSNNGTIAIRVASGYKLNELHDLAISSPVDKASLYYSNGLWRDTTQSLLTSDTAAMLTPYLRKLDTINLSNRINLKLNISDTSTMLLPYLRKVDTTILSNRIDLKSDKSITISTTAPLQGGGDLSSNRTLSILSASDTQSGVISTSTQLFSGNKVFKHRLTADSLFYLNNTTPIPVDILGLNSTGNVNSVGKFTLGSGLSVSTGTLLADTNFLVTRYDTAAMLTNYFKKSDTLTLSNRINLKLNISDTSSMLTNYLRTGVAASTYLPLTGGTLSGSILNSWTFAYSSAPRNDGAVRRTYTQNLYSANGGTTDRVTHYYTYSGDECCASAPVTMYYGRFNGFYNQANIIYDASIYYHNNNQFYYRAFSEPENKVTFSIKPSNTVNSISGTKADLYLSGDAQIDRSLNIGTTLGVTGATNISNTLSATTGTFTRLNINNTTTEGVLTIKSADFNTASRIEFGDGSVIRKQINYASQYSNLDFRTLAVGGGEGGYSFYTRRNPNAEILSFVIDRDGNSNFYGTLGVTGATTLSNQVNLGYSNGFTGSGILTDPGNISGIKLYDAGLGNMTIFNKSTSSSFGSIILSTGNSSNLPLERMRITQNGDVSITNNTTIGGTTTMTGALTVNNATVLNEGSGDYDTRIESDGNANMVFVDASTDRVGIGTNAPTKTLDVNGEVKIATTTATPTSLLGKDGSNVVGNVRVITPLALAGDSINLNTVPISKGGTGSTSESGARSNLGVGYVFYASTAGDAIQLSSNKVFIVNSGGASTTTITLGTATAGRLYMIKNLATGTVVSNSSNVIPLNGGSAGTAILSAGNTTTQWCTLVCDGTNWHIMQSN